MRTLGTQLDRHHGVGPGFDLVRLALATLVLFIHTALIGGAPESAPAFAGAPFGRWAINIAAVPMFFALSGFLIAASAERLSVGRFLTNRLLRIVPALGVAVVLAALVLGPLMTSAPLAAYLSDARFFSYFLNVVGSAHYELPGLFTANPEPGVVNGSLWTVPHEITCYLGVAALMVCGLHRRRRLLLAVMAALFGVAVFVFLCGRLGAPLPRQETLSYVFVTRGAARLVPVFLLGMVIYHYRHSIPYRGDVALAAVALYFAIASFGSPDWAQNPIFNLAAAPLFAYVVIAAGLSPALKVDALKGSDASYGIYLYGYPVQQAIVATFPDLKSAPVFFLLSFMIVAPIAALSWRYVEKPILKLRRGRREPVVEPAGLEPGWSQALAGAPNARPDAAAA